MPKYLIKMLKESPSVCVDIINQSYWVIRQFGEEPSVGMKETSSCGIQGLTFGVCEDCDAKIRLTILEVEPYSKERALELDLRV